MTASDFFLSLHNVSCARGGRMLFENLTADLSAGEVLELRGANGTGKTSLLRAIAGALDVDGRISWQGGDVGSEHISFLPADDRVLKMQETAFENLSFWADVWGKNETSVTQALVQMNLSTLKDKQVRYFSAGQKRRLSIARTLMKDAPLLLLDEPFNALDAESSMLLQQAIKARSEKGLITIIAGHHSTLPHARVLTIGGAA